MKLRVTDISPNDMIVKSGQNISVYTVNIDIFLYAFNDLIIWRNVSHPETTHICNKTCNSNFYVTINVSDKSRERCLPSDNLQNYVLDFFFQNTNRNGEIPNREVSFIFLAPIHVSYTLKVMWCMTVDNKNCNFFFPNPEYFPTKTSY